jgi:hypothetical protein
MLVLDLDIISGSSFRFLINFFFTFFSMMMKFHSLRDNRKTFGGLYLITLDFRAADPLVAGAMICVFLSWKISANSKFLQPRG